jgi:hypothetical protein
MSYELFAHYVLDTGFHRHDDVDGFFTITAQPPAGDSESRALLSVENEQ